MLKKKLLIFLIMILSFLVQQGCVRQRTENIRIGVLTPLTKNNANLGVSVRDGVKLFIDEYNSNKNLNGKKIIVEEYDEEESISKTIDGFNALCDKKCDAIIGGVISVPTLAIVPSSNDCNMPFVVASASSGDITLDSKTNVFYDNVFRACFLNRVQGEKMADFSKEIMKSKTAAILFSPENDYSVELKDFFEGRCKQNGVKILAVESFQENSVDFQSQLSSILSKNPDVLFIPHYYEKIALIAKQARDAGFTIPLIGCDAWCSVSSYLESSPNLLDGSFYSSGYSCEQEDECSNNFLNLYRRKFKKDPNMYDALGYDSAKILVSALEKVVNDNIVLGSEKFKSSVIEALKLTNLEGVTGHIIFDKHNNSSKNVVIMKIIDGEERYWGNY
ncbi:MAG: ABC transporter substrate-binding protein [Clostridiales bacterium]|jgi:branched-chain amino acid transport system substrate-binding protein|nr:ABC transporter substrate-binding protein [Clostridiales bacterium]